MLLCLALLTQLIMFVPVRAGLVTEVRESVLAVGVLKKKKVGRSSVCNVLNCLSFLKLKPDI